MKPLLHHAAPFLAGIAVVSGFGAVRLSARPASDRIAANDNRMPAGRLERGTLTVSLDVRRGDWYPEAEDGLHENVLSFASKDRGMSIPGPLIRAPQGTAVTIALRNTVDDTLTFHGLGSGADTVFRMAGHSRREVRFTLEKPGTYYYWGSTNDGTFEDRPGFASQLYGAIVVDSSEASAKRARDRVFVIGVWFVPIDSSGSKPWVPRDMMVINGKSWPHTETFDFRVGDTVRWRWVNPSPDAHPMHLHGFFFNVTSRGGETADTIYPEREKRLAVTELMMPGGTMSLEWTPRVAGNWLFHCHFAFHVSPYLSFAKIPDLDDPAAPDAVVHHVRSMRGLVLGIHVRDPHPAVRDAVTVSPRAYRVLVQSAPSRYGKAPGYGYVLDDGRAPIPADSVPVMSSLLLLHRGERADVTVVNRMPAPTAVHWHGIELDDSYSDGVPGWSGMDGHVANPIAPGDSFVAHVTPKRTGTFIYHAHSHEAHQIASGLYGPLIVVDPDSAYDPSRNLVFVIGANPAGDAQARVNGQLDPRPVELTAGKTYRVRVIQIHPDVRYTINLEGKAVGNVWTSLAKDGADLPAWQRHPVSTAVAMGPGETADYLFAPAAAGKTRFVVTAQISGIQTIVPIVVR